MKTKKNRALSVVLIFLGIIMLFPIYILFMVSFRNEHTIFQASMITCYQYFNDTNIVYFSTAIYDLQTNGNYQYICGDIITSFI